jgi:hypothetical protein
VDGCTILGRYTIVQRSTAAEAAAIAAGALAPRARQALYWNLKKVAKVVAGDLYLGVRKTFLK